METAIVILLVIVVILFCVPLVLCWRRWRHELPLEVGAGKARTVRVQPIGHGSDEIQRDRFKDPKHSYFAEKRKRARVVLERRAKRRKLRGTHHGCQINAQPWGVQTSRVSMTHAQDVIDPHIPFKDNAGRSLKAFTGRHGHRPRTPDAAGGDDELEAYFRRVS